MDSNRAFLRGSYLMGKDKNFRSVYTLMAVSLAICVPSPAPTLSFPVLLGVYMYSQHEICSTVKWKHYHHKKLYNCLLF